MGALPKRKYAKVGHRVDLASSGRDGLAKATGVDYQLAILDVGLPDLDGIAVAGQLAALRARFA